MKTPSKLMLQRTYLISVAKVDLTYAFMAEMGQFQTEGRRMAIIVHFWGLLVHSPHSFYQLCVCGDFGAA